MRNWNSPQKLDWNPKWFRVRFLSRKIVDDKQETHVCFTSGPDLKTVKAQMKESAGIGFIAKVTEVEYDSIVKGLEK